MSPDQLIVAAEQTTTRGHPARGITYLERMPTEMRVMAMRDAAARDTAITHTTEFVRFGVEYRELIQ